MSGSQLDKRVESLARYGPRLQEVVALRERVAEVAQNEINLTRWAAPTDESLLPLLPTPPWQKDWREVSKSRVRDLQLLLQ